MAHFVYRFLRTVLNGSPEKWRAFVYRFIHWCHHAFASEAGSSVIKLPLVRLALKRRENSRSHNEARALHFVNNRLNGIVNAPFLVDGVHDKQYGNVCWTLMTYISGDLVCDIWDNFDERDRDMLAEQLATQINAMHSSTQSQQRAVSDACGEPLVDYRIPWVGEDVDPVLFNSSIEFTKEVWPAVPQEEDLHLLVHSIIGCRRDPIVFCHGDILRKNLILPGGLERWRAGQSPVCIIDWETAAWAPRYWDALKASYLDPERHTPWVTLVRKIFPDCCDVLDVDWEWRSRTRVTLL